MTTIDTFLTIETPSEEILYKEKNSKFFGYAFPIENIEAVKSCIAMLQKLHPSAGHFCYAYQIGVSNKIFRTNDAGEPNNSAGVPILGQINSFCLTNVLVVVVRYFGGTKLGVSGLMVAYKKTAQMVLENSKIIEKIIQIPMILFFDYKNINLIMRKIKEKKIHIISQEMEIRCKIKIFVRQKNALEIFELFNNLQDIEVKLAE